MVKYTIVCVHYNMVETVERSIRSMLDQVDNKFEVLVVDDGSDDGSLEILRKLQKDYDNLRVIELERNNQRSLGETRNIALKEARGDYVLQRHDADDYYYSGAFDSFVELYHQLERQLDFDFYGPGNMAKKEFLTEIGGYRDLPIGAEDLDLWRRLISRGAMIRVKVKDNIRKEIGPGKSILNKIKRGFQLRYGDLKAGISFWSYIKWSLLEDSKWKIPYNLSFITLAYLKLLFEFILGREIIYEAPKPLRKKGDLKRKSKEYTLSELEEKYGVEINEDKFPKVKGEIIYKK